MERDRVYLPKNPSLPTVPRQLATLPCFFAILESSFDGIFITNGQAVPIWVNHSYEVISGLSAQDVLGIPMDELVRRGLISNSATLQAGDRPLLHRQPVLRHRQAGPGHQHPHL